MNYRQKLEPIVRMAGELALSLRNEGLRVQYKQDGSPVTNADHAVSDFLFAALQAAFPGDGLFCEENHELASLKADRVWLIDPIDGTKHYIAGKDDFCVMLCLMQQEPIVSVLYYPGLDIWYYAERGKGAFRTVHGEEKQLRVREPPSQPVVHRSKTVGRAVGVESTRGTVKHFLLIAKGELDCFIQSRREYWDFYPPALVLTEAGGVLTDYSGRKLVFDTEKLVHEEFIAGHASVVQKVVELLSKR